ncbi:MAG TPA: hypothetical protein VFX49_02730 [Chloroflexota bacterium]|nr:hypothetical protein [Chloroflexota bacterium]
MPAQDEAGQQEGEAGRRQCGGGRGGADVAEERRAGQKRARAGAEGCRLGRWDGRLRGGGLRD